MTLDLFFIDLAKKMESNLLNSIFTNIIIEKSIYIWVAIIALLICIKRTRKLGIVAGISFLLALVLGEAIIKPLVGRERPFITYGYDIIGKKPNSFSFPSTSATLSFSMLGSFLFTKNKYSILVGLFALTICVSRIYLGVHYFSDILGGLLLGILSSYIVSKLMNKKLCFNNTI